MKILIVEDETKLANSIAEGLKHKGFSADIVSDGKIALSRIINVKDGYDLIILDLMLPSLDGESICVEVRQSEIMTPILILTARTETETKVKLLSSGADDYLVKPFSFDELVARINALGRRPREITPSTIEINNIVLNSESRTVLRNKKPILLTLKEFQILEYLMQHQNQVISREIC